MKKEILRVPEYNSDENILFYTIVSSETDLVVCSAINKCFGVNLSLSDDVIVRLKSNLVNFRRYQSDNEEDTDKFILIVNKNNGYFLFPELKKIDYILLVISEDIMHDYSHQLNNFKAIPGITAVIHTDPSDMKSFQRLKI